MNLKEQVEVPVLVGIDIEPDNIQISWFGKNMKEPETIGLQVGVDKYKFPLCIYYSSETDEYSIGQAAQDSAKENESGVFVPKLWHDAMLKKKVSINNKMVSCVDLLQIFFEELLRIIDTFSGNSKVDAIAYTSKTMEPETIDVLKSASKKFEEKGTKLYFKTYAESYCAYLLNQSQELYSRNSVLFYMSKGVLDIYSITLNRKYKPYAVHMQTEQVKGFEAFEEIMFATEEEKNILDTRFLSTAKELFGGALISTVFLTGDGFDKEWLDNSLKYLCQGRRVFQGKNLFTKGACFFLMEEYGTRIYDFKGDNRLEYIVKVPLWQEGNSSVYTVYDGKGDWYQLNDEIECLLDNCETVSVEIMPVNQEALKVTKVIELKGLANRPNLGTKIKIAFNMINKDVLKIKVVDEGLGEFYSSTGKVWEEKVDLSKLEFEEKNLDNNDEKAVLGKLVKCNEVKPERAFYIRCIEKKVYTIEELCFFFYNEVYFVEEFHDWAELAGWIKREMKMEELSKQIQKLIVGYDTKLQMIQLILEYARYRGGEELIEYESKMVQLHKSTGFLRNKKRADYLVLNGKYNQAIELYNQILKSENLADDNIKSQVYHNMGVVYGYMFHFEKAAEYFLKSFSIVPSRESLKQYKLAIRLSDKEEIEKDEILDLPSVQQLDALLEDEINSVIEAEFGAEEPFDNIVKKKSEGKVSEYYGEINEILNTWKEQCRSYV